MLRDRILTAAVLLAVVLAVLFWSPSIGWIALVTAMLAFAAWEWAALAALHGAARMLYAAAVALAGWFAASAAGLPAPQEIYWTGTIFWAVGAPVWLWKRPRFDAPWLPLLAGIVVLVPCGAALVELRRGGPGTLLAIMAVVWVSDTAAYFAGRRYGRRKLAPAISPGKTWEGVAGALAAVTVYAIGWLIAAPNARPQALREAPLGGLWFVILLLVFAGAGVLGDLLESQLKRHAGVKDSGKILPGHGGVLDRIDALLPVLPLAALAFRT